MKICEYCNKEHDGTYASGRFCSVYCAHGFCTKAKRSLINEKVSKTFEEKQLKKQIKKKYCVSCKKEIKTGKRKYCKECHKYIQNKEFFKKLGVYQENLLKTNQDALNLLKKEYFIKRKSLGDLTNKYNVQPSSIHFFFKKNGIILKTVSQGVKDSILNGKLSRGGNNQYKCGWHTTWNNKKVYLRSSYELDYAKMLDSYRILYGVEAKRIEYFDTIKNKNRIAIPDFYLLDLNMLIEIKSSYTLDLQNMKDKFKEYEKLGYKTKLILDKKEVDLYETGL